MLSFGPFGLKIIKNPPKKREFFSHVISVFKKQIFGLCLLTWRVVVNQFGLFSKKLLSEKNCKGVGWMGRQKKSVVLEVGFIFLTKNNPVDLPFFSLGGEGGFFGTKNGPN